MDYNEIETIAKELKELYRAEETVKKNIKAKEKMLKEEMKERGVSFLEAGIYKLRYIQFTQERFDSQKLKICNETLYNQFTKVVNSSKFTIDD